MLKKNKSILLIEDDLLTLRIWGLKLEHAFRDSEIRILLAKNAKTGIKKALTFNPLLIILDLGLKPEGTEGGFRVIDELRKDEVTKKIPIIVVTAFISEENRERAHKLQVAHYLQKPITEEELLKAVMSLMPREDPRHARKNS